MHHLFSDMYGNYIYDSVVNDATEVTDKFYQQAKENKLDLSDSEIFKEYSKLKKLGYYPERENSISYLNDELLEVLLDRSISKLTLQVTQACNLRCKYCAYSDNNGMERKHTAKNMAWYTAKKALDFFHTHSIDSRFITIGFYGGEPLLNFDLIKKSILYSEQIFEGKPLLFSMTTNATLLTEDVLCFLEKRDVALTISLDGPKQLNDMNRVFESSDISTFDIVKEKLENIFEKHKRLLTHLSINMVLDPAYPYEQYQKIYSEIPGLHNIIVRASPVSDDNLTIKHTYCNEYIQQTEYAKFIYRIVDIGKKSSMKALNQTNILSNSFRQTFSQIKRMIGPNVHITSPAGPCIPAFDKLFVDSDGKFLPCEKVPEILPELNIGDVDAGYDMDRIRNLVMLPELTRNECEKCWCFNMCGACVKYCVDKEGISKTARLSFCKMSRQMAMDMLYHYVSMKRHNELINIEG